MKQLVDAFHGPLDELPFLLEGAHHCGVSRLGVSVAYCRQSQNRLFPLGHFFFNPLVSFVGITNISAKVTFPSYYLGKIQIFEVGIEYARYEKIFKNIVIMVRLDLD
jgi:hypothetical protein